MVEGRRSPAPLLHQIYKLLSDTMLTWVNNVRAKQEYQSAKQSSEVGFTPISQQDPDRADLQCGESFTQEASMCELEASAPSDRSAVARCSNHSHRVRPNLQKERTGNEDVVEWSRPSRGYLVAS